MYEYRKLTKEEVENINKNSGMSRADLSAANLSGIDLSDADLSAANLSRANLSRADLRGANLYNANLYNTDLSCADLSGADLSRADLSGADLSGANLSAANLSNVNLSEADLSRADLRGAELYNADLRHADLSGVRGLLSAKDFLSRFERDRDGAIICYKTFNSTYAAPDAWQIDTGQFITEVCNPNRTNDCGCGVNVATLEWVKGTPDDTIWECRIMPEDFTGIVVPYNTYGSFRAERVQLVKVVE